MLLLLAAGTAAAEPNHLVRIEAKDFEATLRALEQAGYDLAGHDRAAGTIEVVVGAEQIDGLSAYGQATLLRSSRPFREVITERLGRALQLVPDGNYKTYPEILAFMDQIEAQFPAIARKVDLTDLLGVPATWDGRHVFAMKISDNVGLEEDEPAVLFDALHHARELNTIEVALNIIDHLTSGYASGETAPLVDQLAIWVVPAVNPDGLEYVWSNNDMWRKNRRNNGNGSFGVDPNRNYPFKWGVCGSNSGTPSSNTYRGPAAASEPEVQTMVALGQRIRPVFYNSYHSSGREVLPPYVCGTLAETQMVNTIRDRYRNAMNYATRAASSSGESFEWFYNQVSSVGFLTEISTAFQPPFNETLAEVDRVRPGWLLLLDLVANGSFPLVEGRVSDATTGLPLEAEIESSAVPFAEGERRASEPSFGRFDWFLRSVEQDLTFSAEGYLSRTIPVLPIDGVNVVDVALQPEGPPLPTVTVVASDASASEAGLDGGAYTVSRSGGTGAALTVRYTVSGTATAGSDYQALSGAVTIPVGQSAAEIAVTPLDDPNVESDETVSLALSGDAAYEVGSPSNATVTITSDDVGALVCPAGSIDFSAFPLEAYSNQDNAGTISVESNGDVLFMEGNRWRRSTQSFQVTPDTVIDFFYQSGEEGEIHGIGFDEDQTLTNNTRVFQFWGTQNWGSAFQHAPRYSGSGEFESFSIPVGQFYTGNAMRLVFVNDKDAGAATNQGRFACVQVSQEPPPGCGAVLHTTDFESGANGWSHDAAQSSCTTGDWVVGDPSLVTSQGVTTQLGDDHTAAGVNAFFTQPNTANGVDDVDNGVCTAQSPTIDASGFGSVEVSFWYYHGQRDAGDDPGDDFFRIDLSNDGGASYATNLVSIGDVTSNAAWTQVTRTVTNPDQLRIRVQAADGAGPGDLVEGGLDDVLVCAP